MYVRISSDFTHKCYYLGHNSVRHYSILLHRAIPSPVTYTHNSVQHMGCRGRCGCAGREGKGREGKGREGKGRGECCGFHILLLF